LCSPEHTALHAIKPYDQRFDTTKWLESDADEQLIIKIPFTGSVKLKVFNKSHLGSFILAALYFKRKTTCVSYTGTFFGAKLSLSTVFSRRVRSLYMCACLVCIAVLQPGRSERRAWPAEDESLHQSR